MPILDGEGSRDTLWLDSRGNPNKTPCRSKYSYGNLKTPNPHSSPHLLPKPS